MSLPQGEAVAEEVDPSASSVGSAHYLTLQAFEQRGAIVSPHCPYRMEEAVKALPELIDTLDRASIDVLFRRVLAHHADLAEICGSALDVEVSEPPKIPLLRRDYHPHLMDEEVLDRARLEQRERSARLALEKFARGHRSLIARMEEIVSPPK